MDDFIVQFKGFSPTRLARNYLRGVLNLIHDEAPASSTLEASIAKTGKKMYTGYIRISSHAGPFLVKVSSPKLTGLAQQLLEQSRRELDRWKSQRVVA